VREQTRSENLYPGGLSPWLRKIRRDEGVNLGAYFAGLAISLSFLPVTL